jgi:predicted RNase H-like nuclease (RuvC/YqgF family)
MKIKNRFGLFNRLLGDGPRDGGDAALRRAAADGHLRGGELEQAYRELLLEHQVLAESNERLVERLARRQKGGGDPQAHEELLRVQRNALVERSHRLRELEYANKQLQREHSKLAQENQRLRAELERQERETRALAQREQTRRRELAQLQAALRDKTSELVTMSRRYYQPAAQPQAPRRPSSAANGDF